MNFGDLRNLCLSRCGDVAFFRGAPGPTIAPLARVNAELNSAYEDLVNVLAMHHYFHVETYEDVTWPANTREIDLESELASVPRELLYVGVYPAGTGGGALPYPVFQRGDHATIATNRASQRRVGGFEASAYYLTGNTLGRNQLISEAQTVHVGYAPLVETLSSDGASPAQAPANLHQYIAQRAAFVLLGGANGAPQFVREELNRLEFGVQRWCEQRRGRLGKRLPGFAARKV